MQVYLHVSFAVLVFAVLWGTYTYVSTQDSSTPVFGGCDPRFEDVFEAFKLGLARGGGKGEAFSAYYEGQLVCDVWGGYSDIQARRPWSQDTVSLFLSATKAVAAICVAVLVDRGQLDYNAPVSKYWQGFGENGKEEITVKSLVSHQAGLPVLSSGQLSAYAIFHDHAKVAKLLEEQFPNWRPGSVHGYHVITYGLYLDQLVRHVDRKGRGISDFFDEEIARPFAIDFYVGLPKELHYRASRYEKPSFCRHWLDLLLSPSSLPSYWLRSAQPKSWTARAYQNPPDVVEDNFNRANWPEYRGFPFSSFFGYGTARSMAKLLGVLANVGTDGEQKLLSAETIAQMVTPAVSGTDEILQINMTYGLGFFLLPHPVRKHGWIFGHSGEGGQQVYGDVESRLGWAYVSNYHAAAILPESSRYLTLLNKMYTSVSKIVRKKYSGTGFT